MAKTLFIAALLLIPMSTGCASGNQALLGVFGLDDATLKSQYRQAVVDSSAAFGNPAPVMP